MVLPQAVRTAVCHMLAHVVHLVVLLLPTIVLAGLESINAVVVSFASVIAIAAVLEASAVSKRFEASRSPVCDPMAIHVACAVGIGLLVLFWAAQIENLVGSSWPGLIHAFGVLLTALGAALRFVAIRTLGERFVSDIQAGDVVERDGIYAWLRHPSEIGLLFIAIGGPLLIGAPWTSLAAAILLLPVSMWRMRREDQALAHH